jgi:chromosome segregation ATPase
MASNFKNIAITFGYEGDLPNFERDQFATLSDMKQVVDTIDEGHMSFCKETKKHYVFHSSNTLDATTGKWREIADPAEVAASKQTIEAQKTKLQSIEGTVNQQKQTISQAKSKADDNAGKIATLESTIQQLQTKITQLESAPAHEDQITFLKSIAEYEALPTEKKNKDKHLFVIGKTTEV